MTRDSPTRAFSIDIAGLFRQRHGGTAQKERDESSLQKCFLRQGQFTRNSARARDGSRPCRLLSSATFIHAPRNEVRSKKNPFVCDTVARLRTSDPVTRVN